jgi:hypothetical protein
LSPFYNGKDDYFDGRWLMARLNIPKIRNEMGVCQLNFSVLGISLGKDGFLKLKANDLTDATL